MTLGDLFGKAGDLDFDRSTTSIVDCEQDESCVWTFDLDYRRRYADKLYGMIEMEEQLLPLSSLALDYSILGLVFLPSNPGCLLRLWKSVAVSFTQWW